MSFTPILDTQLVLSIYLEGLNLWSPFDVKSRSHLPVDYTTTLYVKGEESRITHVASSVALNLALWNHVGFFTTMLSLALSFPSFFSVHIGLILVIN